jgi:hypothetical protein
MLNQYLAGINPELYAIWQRLENLSRNMETILSDMRTLLVSLRQTESREAQTAQNQGTTNGTSYRQEPQHGPQTWPENPPGTWTNK